MHVLVACPSGFPIPQVAVMLQSLLGKVTGQQSWSESQPVARRQKLSTLIQLFWKGTGFQKLSGTEHTQMLLYLKSGLVHAYLSSKFGKCYQGGRAINSGLNPCHVEYRLKSVSLDCAWAAVLWVIVHPPLFPFYSWIPCRPVVRPLVGGKLVQILPGVVMPKPGSSWG